MSNTSSRKISKAKLWMVLVGVNHYQDNSIRDLKYCANDCKELAEALTIATKEFKDTEIVALHDGGMTPTLEEVVSSLEKFNQAQSDDTILFYFSGHGELDSNNRPVLGLANTKVVKNDSDETYSFDSATGLKLDSLLEELRNSPAQNQLIWLDACQVQDETKYLDVSDANSQILTALSQERDLTRRGKNFFAMLSCDETERSWEFAELQHGLFTYSLIKGLQGNAANERGEIGIYGLFEYVKNNINEYLDLKKHPVTTEVGSNSAKGHNFGLTSQVNKFPEDVFQKPRKIDSSQEVDLIIGLVPPSYNRKALIIDRLSFSLVDIEFCKFLQDRGGFAVEHCFLEDKTQANLTQRISKYLQNKANETVLLYLAGEIKQSNDSEYSLVINQENIVNLNWLGQQLRDLPFKEAIIIVDILEQQKKHPDIRDILNPDENKSLCLIAASSKKANQRIIHQIVEILDEAAEEEAQLWAATLITQLQKKADFPQELSLQKLGLYSSSTAINILLPKSRRTNNQIYDLNLSPYKSLQAFTQDDAYFFHGRETLIGEIIEKLESTSFLAVVGASGSGKSSVVRAAIVPQLIAEGLYSLQYEEYLPCQTYVMRPGDNPLNALATALDSNNPELAEGFLHIGVDSFVTWLQQQSQELSVLVIDQFEELFTTENKTESNKFIQLIVGAVNKTPNIFKVIITLRNDFLDDCLANQHIDPLFRQSHVLVPSYLTEAEYRQILNQPAEKVGLTIEEELVNVLLQELQQDSLPLLQFALDELWQKRTPGTLTLANYQKNVGGLGAILGKKAEETMNKLNLKQQECAQSIFQDLVQLGEGKEDTRRRISREKLKKTKYEAVFDSTLKELVDARLLVIGSDGNNTLAATPSPTEENKPSETQTTVEIAHEILIRKWKTLISWLNTNRTQIRLGRELEQKAEEWVNTPKDKKDKFLLPEAGLIKYQDLYSDRTDELRKEVKQFIKLSQEKCDRLKRQEEARRNRELKQERKARINAQRFAWALGIGLIVSIGLAGLAYWQRKLSRINETNALINSSEALLSSNQELNALITLLKTGRKAGSEFNLDTKIKFLGNLHNTFQRVKERNRLEEHSGNVFSSVFSPDGQILASASGDGTVKLWTPQGKLLKTLEVSEGYINKLKFSPDGQTIISHSGNGTVRLWDRQGELLKTFDAHRKGVKDLIISPDGQTIISHSGEDSVKIWNFQGRLIHTLEAHEWGVTSIALSPNGKTLASGGRKGIIKLWNLQGDLLRTLNHHTWKISSMEFSPDGKTLASASNDQTVKLWNLQGKLINNLIDHNNPVGKVAFSRDGKIIASASVYGKIILWDNEGQLINSFVGHNWDNTGGNLIDIKFSPNGKFFASIVNDKTVNLWNLQGELLRNLEGHTWFIEAIEFTPDSNILASASVDDTIKLWDLTEDLPITLKGHDFSIKDVAMSPDGKTVASASRDQTIKLWDNEGQFLKTLEGHTNDVTSVKFAPDGKTIISTSYDDTLRLWDVDGRLIDVLKGHSDIVINAEFSPDGKTIASASNDRTVKLWNLKGELLHTLEGHSEDVNTVVFSPDGKTIASASSDHTVRLWNLQGKLLHTLEGHTLFVRNIEFILDGKIIASSGGDDTINLWNLKGELLTTLKGHSSDILNLAFNSNSLILASASEKAIVKLWSLDLDEVMTRGCDWVQDYLANNANISEEDRKICNTY